MSSDLPPALAEWERRREKCNRCDGTGFVERIERRTLADHLAETGRRALLDHLAGKTTRRVAAKQREQQGLGLIRSAAMSRPATAP